tara:strand:+ start:93 stop:533 length:441 start_codon:yes stop_codon:yes gene_type:complete
MNISYCLIGFTLLFSSIYMSYLKKDNDMFVNFMNVLDEKQKEIYTQIIYERLMIYIAGMVIGLILGLYYLFSNRKDNYRLCKFLCIIYVVKLGFYYFYPKSPLMLYSLTSKEQVDSWADIYLEMKNRWKESLIVGLLGYLILSFIV